MISLPITHSDHFRRDKDLYRFLIGYFPCNFYFFEIEFFNSSISLDRVSHLHNFLNTLTFQRKSLTRFATYTLHICLIIVMTHM